MEDKGFVFGKTSGSKPQTVTAATELKAYLTQYVDGAGKEQVRVVFKIPGNDTCFILQERISGQFVATSASDWFNTSLGEKLNEGNTAESI